MAHKKGGGKNNPFKYEVGRPFQSRNNGKEPRATDQEQCAISCLWHRKNNNDGYTNIISNKYTNVISNGYVDGYTNIISNGLHKNLCFILVFCFLWNFSIVVGDAYGYLRT